MGTGNVRVEGPPLAGVTEGATAGNPRADFRPGDFDRTIDAHGSRLAWMRAIVCPCKPLNTQTQQPNPTCPRCRGEGWSFFGDSHYEIPVAAGTFDECQTSIIQESNASVIRGVIVGARRQDQPYTQIGNWISGSAMLTVRAANRLGFNDRIVDLDSEVTYSQVVEVEWTKGITPRPIDPRLQYRPIAINFAQLDDGTRLFPEQSFRLSPDGKLSWAGSAIPRAGRRVAFHYLHHATYRVVEWPHQTRRAQVLANTPVRRTPNGEPTALPVQVMIKLEHLVDGALR